MIQIVATAKPVQNRKPKQEANQLPPLPNHTRQIKTQAPVAPLGLVPVNTKQFAGPHACARPVYPTSLARQPPETANQVLTRFGDVNTN